MVFVTTANLIIFLCFIESSNVHGMYQFSNSTEFTYPQRHLNSFDSRKMGNDAIKLL